MKQQKILLYYIHVCTLISLQIYILRDHNIHKCLGQLGCFHNNLISTSFCEREKRSNHTDFDHDIYDNLLFRSKKNQDEFIPWTVTGSLYSGAGFIQQ